MITLTRHNRKGTYSSSLSSPGSISASTSASTSSSSPSSSPRVFTNSRAFWAAFRTPVSFSMMNSFAFSAFFWRISSFASRIYAQSPQQKLPPREKDTRQPSCGRTRADGKSVQPLCPSRSRCCSGRGSSGDYPSCAICTATPASERMCKREEPSCRRARWRSRCVISRASSPPPLFSSSSGRIPRRRRHHRRTRFSFRASSATPSASTRNTHNDLILGDPLLLVVHRLFLLFIVHGLFLLDSIRLLHGLRLLSVMGRNQRRTGLSSVAAGFSSSGASASFSSGTAGAGTSGAGAATSAAGFSLRISANPRVTHTAAGAGAAEASATAI